MTITDQTPLSSLLQVHQHPADVIAGDTLSLRRAPSQDGLLGGIKEASEARLFYSICFQNVSIPMLVLFHSFEIIKERPG